MNEKYLLTVSALADTEDIDSLISAFGAEYISSLCKKSEHARRQSLCGAAHLLSLCREAKLLGRDLTVRRNEWGKPYFAEYPDIFFSISHDEKKPPHGGGAVACVLSENAIGVDLTLFPPRPSPEAQMGIAERFFSPHEVELLRNTRDGGELFATLWTRREAYSKLLGGPLSDALGIDIPSEYIFETKKSSIGDTEYVISVCSRTK